MLLLNFYMSCPHEAAKNNELMARVALGKKLEADPQKVWHTYT
jgi:hypothetical protein